VRALTDVAPSHLLDRKLFDFAGLKATGVALAEELREPLFAEV